MGSRKHNTASVIKEARKKIASAKLNNCPTSPRKMRLVADMVRGMEVTKALYALKHNGKEASIRLEKLLVSALSNWQTKNEGVSVDETQLIVQTISVDSGRMLKRVQPAPQGRAHRVRKRSNHVTIVVGEANNIEKTSVTEVKEVQ